MKLKKQAIMLIFSILAVAYFNSSSAMSLTIINNTGQNLTASCTGKECGGFQNINEPINNSASKRFNFSTSGHYREWATINLTDNCKVQFMYHMNPATTIAQLAGNQCKFSGSQGGNLDDATITLK